MAETGGSPQLDYAPKPPNSGRAKAYRWFIWIAVAIALFMCRAWPLAVWHHVRLLYLQTQCINNPIPAGSIAYSSGTPVVSVVSPQWAAFAAADPNCYFSLSNKSTATVFVGRLQATNGIRRLVVVEAKPNWKPKGFSEVMIFTHTIELGATIPLRENVQPGGGATCNAALGWPGTMPDIVVHSATLDPNDPSHLNFDCRLFQEDYIVDGYLGNDGLFTLTKWNPTTLPFTARGH
jgi:hypothetical protein